MRSILLHIHFDPGQDSRLAAAADLARLFEGQLTLSNLVVLRLA